MQFENTETFKNLARSFAGECQAGKALVAAGPQL